MTLQEQIANYHPGDETIQIIRSSRIVLLVGIAGAGKDTIKQQLLASGRYADIVSHTTRQPRTNSGRLEENGIDYWFVDNARIAELLESHAFIEAKFVHGTVYGTSIQALQTALKHAGIAITDVDVQGVDEYVAIAPDTVTPVFLVPPSYNTWLQRLKNRYATEEEFRQEWPKRRESAVRELTKALDSTEPFRLVVNDDLAATVQSIDQIITREHVYDDSGARNVARLILNQLTVS